jgi:hypothetical protein
MTKEEAIEMARCYAYAFCDTHKYLPQSIDKLESWLPHMWVVAAILEAAGNHEEAAVVMYLDNERDFNAHCQGS